MSRTVAFLLLPFLLIGCQKEKEDGARTAALADQLVTCQNERGALKEQLAQAQGELRKAQEAPKAAPHEADPPPRSGRTPSARSLLHTPSVLSGGRPALPAPRLGPSNPEAEARTAQEVARIVKSHVGQLRPCYERGLKRNANVQFISQLKVQLSAMPDGRIQEVHFSPRTEADMEACMTQAITRWRVPSYKGQPVVLEVPVNLKVQGG